MHCIIIITDNCLLKPKCTLTICRRLTKNYNTDDNLVRECGGLNNCQASAVRRQAYDTGRAIIFVDTILRICMNYEVKDIGLAPQGRKNLELAERNMGALLAVRKRFQKEQPFKGKRIGIALHVTKETGILVRTLRAGGATVAITGCNPLSTQDDVAAALAEEGVHVYAYKGETTTDYYRYLDAVVESRPHITIDDGCDLISRLHTKYKAELKNVLGGCEETTTGVIRLRAMERDKALKIPVIAVNDNKTKHLMDNYYGTGQSVIDGITRATNLLWSGKVVVVVGYGSCGKGVAMRAHGMGAIVVVCEVDAFRALQARMDGYHVMPLIEAAAKGDVFITLTGNKNVLTAAHFKRMKSGAILANGGHFDAEIDLPSLKKLSRKVRDMRPSMQEYAVGSKVIYVLGEGRLVNLAAAEGHPSEVMSMSFCGQVLAAEYLMKHYRKLKPGVHVLPVSIDDEIAALQLKAMNIGIDTLTGAQKKYLGSWKEGT